jgi:hypothetical protein
VCEVLDVLLTNVPPDNARKIAEAKLLLDGRVGGVREPLLPFTGAAFELVKELREPTQPPSRKFPGPVVRK